MRDHEDRSGVIFQVILKPEQRHQVEVVCRLVEHQQVGLDNEEASEVCSHNPTARHFLGWTIKIVFLVAEAAEHFFGLRLNLGIVESIELAICLQVLRAGDVTCFFEFLECRFEFLEHSGTTCSDFDHSVVSDVLALLWEEAGQGPLVAFDGSFIRFLFAENDPKNGRLAGTVWTDESDSFAVVYLQVGVFEKRVAAVGFFKFSDRKHGSMRDVGFYIAECLVSAN